MKKLAIGLAAFLLAATHSTGIMVQWALPTAYLSISEFKSVALISLLDESGYNGNRAITVEKNAFGETVIKGSGNYTPLCVAATTVSSFEAYGPEFFWAEYHGDENGWWVSMYDANDNPYGPRMNDPFTGESLWPSYGYVGYEHALNPAINVVAHEFVNFAYIFFDTENIDEATKFYIIQGEFAAGFLLEEDPMNSGTWIYKEKMDWNPQSNSYSYSSWQFFQIPEPTTALLFAAGAVVVGLRRRRRV